MAAKAISSSARRWRQEKLAIPRPPKVPWVSSVVCINIRTCMRTTEGHRAHQLTCSGMPAEPALRNARPLVFRDCCGVPIGRHLPSCVQADRQVLDYPATFSASGGSCAPFRSLPKRWPGPEEKRAKGLTPWRCGRERTSSHGSWRPARGCLRRRPRWADVEGAQHAGHGPLGFSACRWQRLRRPALPAFLVRPSGLFCCLLLLMLMPSFCLLQMGNFGLHMCRSHAGC